METLLSGLPIPQGVAYEDGMLLRRPRRGRSRRGRRGAGGAGRGRAARSSVIVAEPGGEIVETYDLLAYELENNPDGRSSSPRTARPSTRCPTRSRCRCRTHRILVADAGANALLAIDRESGEISTLFVPPLVTPEEVPECAEAQANPDVEGCDPVPTGIDEENGKLYLSTLGAEAPGAARVYVLEQDGDEIRRIEGLTSITGLAVDDNDDVYVSELFFGAPEGEPGPGFDPTPVGRVVQIEGTATEGRGRHPASGLEFEDGELYASAWSVAIFLGSRTGVRSSRSATTRSTDIDD